MNAGKIFVFNISVHLRSSAARLLCFHPAEGFKIVHQLRKFFSAFLLPPIQSLTGLPPFLPAGLRPLAAYNVASGRVRESEFDPKEAARTGLSGPQPITDLFSTKRSHFPGHTCPETGLASVTRAAIPNIDVRSAAT